MKTFIAPGWKPIFSLNCLADFDALWDLEAGWFEQPNKRRNGWSGVTKIILKTGDSGSVGVFLKRQENHNTKTWNHPLTGIPTFRREFNNIQRFLSHGIATVKPLYFACRRKNARLQAILISQELLGFESLDAALYASNGELMSNKNQREGLLAAVADEIKKMHCHHLVHSCLYSKHIFVRHTADKWQVKLLDLEKASRTFYQKSALMRDLYTLPRHSDGWRLRDRIRFLRLYQQEQKLSPQSKQIWRAIQSKIMANNKSVKA